MFARNAPAAPFPLDDAIPLPADFHGALHFAADNDSFALRDFRGKQFRRLNALSVLTRPQSAAGYARNP